MIVGIVFCTLFVVFSLTALIAWILKHKQSKHRTAVQMTKSGEVIANPQTINNNV